MSIMNNLTEPMDILESCRQDINNMFERQIDFGSMLARYSTQDDGKVCRKIECKYQSDRCEVKYFSDNPLDYCIDCFKQHLKRSLDVLRIDLIDFVTRLFDARAKMYTVHRQLQSLPIKRSTVSSDFCCTLQCFEVPRTQVCNIFIFFS